MRSPLIAQKIISLIINNGEVRLAEPGEFTKRAFLNSRIDLTQAEAVADIINSRTLVSLRGARNQLDGLLSSRVVSLRERLVNVSSFIELELDFAEEDIELIRRNDLYSKIIDILVEIKGLLDSYTFGKVDMQRHARFVRMTASGLRESHPHDIIITKESPNYYTR